MDKIKQQTLWSAFTEGLSLKKQREWLIEAFTPKSKTDEALKRHNEEKFRREAIENFKVRCKAFGWWMATLLTMLFAGLTLLSIHLGDNYPFVQAIIIPICKWVFGIGFASYAFFNMLIGWEHHFNRYVHKHRELFDPPRSPIPHKHVRGFWLSMMGNTMYFGIPKKLKELRRRKSIPLRNSKQY